MSTTDIWDGGPLGNGLVSLAVFRSNGPPALGAAAAGGPAVLVAPAQFADFLEQHAGRTIVCRDAAVLHRRLSEMLTPQPGGKEALEAFTDCAAAGRVIDLGLVVLCARRLLPPDSPGRLSPSSRFAGYDALCERVPSSDCEVGQGLRRMAEILRAEAEELLVPRLVAQSGPFGPLGMANEMRGLIAADHLGRAGLNLLPDPAGFEEYCRREYARASGILNRIPKANRAFHWRDAVVEQDVSGHPREREGPLREWLTEESRTLIFRSNIPAEPPLNRRGELVLNPEAWGIWSQCKPGLRAWRDLIRSSRLLRWLSDRRNQPTVRPAFVPFPELRSRDPDLDAVRACGIGLFRPSEGSCFLVVGLEELRLRCFAAVCVAGRYGFDHWLGCLIGSCPPGGGDAVTGLTERLAAVLHARFEERQAGLGPTVTALSEDERAFNGLPECERARWLGITKGICETLPYGVPDRDIRYVLEQDYGCGAIDDRRVAELVGLFIDRVAWGSEGFFRDRTEEDFIRRLELPAPEAYERIESRGFETTGAKIRNQLRRGDGTRTAQLLARHLGGKGSKGANDAASAGEDILHPYRETLGGRFTSRALAPEVRRQEVHMLADECMKRVLFAVVSKGFRCVVAAGDEFVLELPTSQICGQAVEARVDAIVNSAVEPLLAELTPPRRFTITSDWPASGIR